jgi:type VI secretion system protein VasD
MQRFENHEHTGMMTMRMSRREIGLWLAIALLMAGCASGPGLPGTSAGASAETGAAAAPEAGVAGLLASIRDKALEATGLKAPEAPDSALPDRRIRWRLHASTSLNVTPQGHSLALLTRVYRLRSPDSFLQAPQAVFGDPVREKEALGDDLVSVREVQLLPGQLHETVDKLPRDIGHVGIVALYRHPARGRWRFAFKAAEAEFSGLQIGAHACALSVQTGQPAGLPPDSMRSVAVPCPQTP